MRRVDHAADRGRGAGQVSGQVRDTRIRSDTGTGGHKSSGAGGSENGSCVKTSLGAAGAAKKAGKKGKKGGARGQRVTASFRV